MPPTAPADPTPAVLAVGSARPDEVHGPGRTFRQIGWMVC
jgi:hypothetical protein